jgi:putative transposase
MPRTNRVSVGNIVYHVINRTNGRVCLFKEDKDYKHFESLLKEAWDLTDMRILSYCLMPNHFHLVLYPKKDNDLSEFMRWLTTTHVRQVRVLTGSVGHGHLYQGSYKSFPVEEDKHLVDLIRYVEQNPFRAGLVKKAQDWLWSSLYIRNYGTSGQKKILDELPTELPHNYLSSVNEIYDSEKLSKLRNSITKGLPYGSDKWTDSMVEKYNLVATTRGVGRPKRV